MPKIHVSSSVLAQYTASFAPNGAVVLDRDGDQFTVTVRLDGAEACMAMTGEDATSEALDSILAAITALKVCVPTASKALPRPPDKPVEKPNKRKPKVYARENVGAVLAAAELMTRRFKARDLAGITGLSARHVGHILASEGWPAAEKKAHGFLWVPKATAAK